MRTIIGVAAGIALAACSSGSGSSEKFQAPVPDLATGNLHFSVPETQTYVPFLTVGEGKSIIEGVMLMETQLASAVGVEQSNRSYVIGVRDNATDRLIITNTYVALEDVSGSSSGSPNSYAYQSDATSGLAVLGEGEARSLYTAALSAPDGAAFDYVRYSVLQIVSPDTRTLRISGVVGVSTSSADMPISGSVDYSNGMSEFILYTPRSIENPNANAVFLDGSATASVDFDNGIVNVEMAFSGGPIGAVSLSDMTISGNAFSGGTHVVTNPAGTDLTAEYDIRRSDAMGMFYGPSDGAKTAELGGIVEFVGNAKSGLVRFTVQ